MLPRYAEDKKKSLGSKLQQSFQSELKFVYLLNNEANPICNTSRNIIKDAQSYFDSLTLAVWLLILLQNLLLFE